MEPFCEPAPRETASPPILKRQGIRYVSFLPGDDIQPSQRTQEIEVKRKQLDNLETDLTELFSLQSVSIGPPDSVSRHDGSLSLFRHFLLEPHLSVNSLLPLPPLENLDLHNLIRDCILSLIAPDRAAWAIQQLQLCAGIARETITNSVIEFAPLNREYSVHFIHELYCRNVVEHFEIIKWLLCNYEVRNLTVFNSEIVGCWPTLKLAIQRDETWLEILAMQL
jgi:hypothetical protein